jgi:hypothetical protein
LKPSIESDAGHTRRPLFAWRIAERDGARESCATSFCTLPEESINGDSIEVVRQESASENDHRIEARVVREREERCEEVVRPEAEKLQQAHSPIKRNEEGRDEATQQTRGAEAIAGIAHQARRDECYPARR